jgi:uncharacterized protein (PEP-CTERM system associated)
MPEVGCRRFLLWVLNVHAGPSLARDVGRAMRETIDHRGRGVGRLFRATPVALAALACAIGSVQAQSVRFEPVLNATATATDNAGFRADDEARKDLILALAPRLNFSVDGSRVKTSGAIGVDALHYTRHSETDRISPYVRGALNAQLVDRWLSLDASADVASIQADAFASRTGEASSYNRRLAGVYRLSPALEHEFTPSVSLSARSDNTWTRLSSEDANGVGPLPSDRLHTQRSSLTGTLKPEPLGMSLELSSERSEFAGDANQKLAIDAARGVASYAVNTDLLLSAVAGRERTRFASLEQSDTVAGARVRWTPGPRTDLRAEIEHRFFGAGLDLGLTHRTPYLATSITFRRSPRLEPLKLGTAAVGTELATFLDAILTTRYPDPVARGKVVQDLIATRGLPTSAAVPVDIVAQYPQLDETGALTIVMLRPRDTVTVSVYVQTLRRLERGNDPLASAGVLDSDARQRGILVGYNHRLSPVLAIDFTLNRSTTEGLAARQGDESTSSLFRVSMVRALSARAAVSAGIARRRSTTNVSGQASATEHSGFAGISYRF